MKILYLSCHSILEYDEVKLLTELGHEVHSFGAYRDPKGAYTLPRPGIPEMKFNQDFFDLTAIHPKTKLPKELIEPYDTIIIMSGDSEAPLIQNWENIKHKRVILRTIGQSVERTEKAISPMRDQGLQIIRYSPKEENIPGYVGGDALIRFYKDETEFGNWIGDDNRPISFVQSLKGRGRFVHYDEIVGAMTGFPGAMVYGTGNNDLGELNGGEMPFDVLKDLMRHARCYVYGGTWPASYTLSFMEALMTGIPMVCVGKSLANMDFSENFDYYEVEDIMADADIPCAKSVDEMRTMIGNLLNDEKLAKAMAKRQRQTAIKYFGKDAIKEQWRQFLK